MPGISAHLRSRNRQRSITVLAMVGIMGAVLVVTLFLLNRTEKALPSRAVDFDPQRCVRVLDVTRVYRIRSNPLAPEQIWFATAEGIRVLDTTRLKWTRYGLDHGLLSETVSDICFAGREIWAATWSGLARFDSGKQTFVPLPFTAGMGGTRILATEYVPGEGMYFSVDERGLFLLKDGSEVPVKIDLPGMRASARLTCLYYASGLFLVGGEGRRLFKKTVGDSGFAELAFNGADSPKTLVWDVLFFNDSLYVATSNDGLYKGDLNGALVGVKGFPAKGAYSLSADTDGFWCGTPFGLWRYHLAGDTWIQFVHPEQRDEATDFQVFALENTPSRVWYGSMDLGAGFLTKRRVEWHNLRSGLTNPNVTAIVSNDSLLFAGFGYQGGYIDVFDSRGLQYQSSLGSERGLKDARVACFGLGAGNTYAGTYSGFARIERKDSVRWYSPEAELPYGDIAQVVQADSQTLLLAGRFGVLTYNTCSGAFAEVAGSAIGRVSAVVADRDTLWYGTLARGVWRGRVGGGENRLLGLNAGSRIMGLGLSGEGASRVLAGASKEDGPFVMSTDGSGVQHPAFPAALLDGTWNSFENHVFCAIVIDGNIWMGLRDHGCLVYNIKGNRWGRFDYYDGLVSDQVRCISFDSQYVWIGCFGGFNRIDRNYLNDIVFIQ